MKWLELVIGLIRVAIQPGLLVMNRKRPLIHYPMDHQQPERFLGLDRPHPCIVCLHASSYAPTSKKFRYLYPQQYYRLGVFRKKAFAQPAVGGIITTGIFLLLLAKVICEVSV